MVENPPILLCTRESDGTLPIALICQLLGLEMCGKKSALMDFKGKNVRKPGAGTFGWLAMQLYMLAMSCT